MRFISEISRIFWPNGSEVKPPPPPWYKRFWTWFWPEKAWDLAKILIYLIVGGFIGWMVKK